jgi:hypothetical protein
MKKVVIVSADVLWDSATQRPSAGIVEVLSATSKAGGIPVMMSSHGKPPWFDEHFGFMQIIECGFNPPRQSGKVVLNLVEANKQRFSHSDFIVVGASDTDFLMAVNSQTFLIRADWATNLGEKIVNYGVHGEFLLMRQSAFGITHENVPASDKVSAPLVWTGS